MARTARSEHGGLWALTLCLALALTGVVYYLGHQGGPATPGPTGATADIDSEPVYIYRCADGSIQDQPCETASAPQPTHELPRLMVYEAPRYRDDPVTRQMIDDADTSYRREVESARRSRSAYEETVAVTNSSQCKALRNERDTINAHMRQPYSSEMGEVYRERLRKNWAAGIKFGCWSGTVAR